MSSSHHLDFLGRYLALGVFTMESGYTAKEPCIKRGSSGGRDGSAPTLDQRDDKRIELTEQANDDIGLERR